MDDLAGRIAVAKQILGDRFSQHGELGGGIDVLRREELTGHHRVVAQRHVVGSHALNDGCPVVAAVDHLHAATDGRRRRAQQRDTGRAIAFASSCVSVATPPDPSRTPLLLMLPGKTMIKLLPML